MSFFGLFLLLLIASCEYGAAMERGDEISIENAPYFASIEYLGSTLAGGAIITNKFVLTTVGMIYMKPVVTLSCR